MDQQPFDTAALLQFLQGCSDTSLADFYTSRLNRDANMRKELHGLLERMVENLADVRLANRIRSHRREVLKLFALPESNLPAELSPPDGLPAPPRRAEPDDASSRRTDQPRKTRSQPG